MKAKILIVDDDQDITTMLEDRLQASDYGTLIAGDGLQALEKVEQEAPHLMLLDLDMPYMSGLELCMYLRGTAQTALTTLVAVSGEASPADRALLEHLGVARFINKTSSAHVIFGQLVNLLRSIELTRSRVLAA